MTLEEVRKWYNRRPFLPFILHTADGGQVKVGHPEFMARSPDGRVVEVLGTDENHQIDILMITRITVIKSNRKKSRT